MSWWQTNKDFNEQYKKNACDCERVGAKPNIKTVPWSCHFICVETKLNVC